MGTRIKAVVDGFYNQGEEVGETDVFIGFREEGNNIELHSLAADFILDIDKDDLLKSLQIIGVLPKPTPNEALIAELSGEGQADAS